MQLKSRPLLSEGRSHRPSHAQPTKSQKATCDGTAFGIGFANGWESSPSRLLPSKVQVRSTQLGQLKVQTSNACVHAGWNGTQNFSANATSCHKSEHVGYGRLVCLQVHIELSVQALPTANAAQTGRQTQPPTLSTFVCCKTASTCLHGRRSGTQPHSGSLVEQVSLSTSARAEARRSHSTTNEGSGSTARLPDSNAERGPSKPAPRE